MWRRLAPAMCWQVSNAAWAGRIQATGPSVPVEHRVPGPAARAAPGQYRSATSASIAHNSCLFMGAHPY